MSISTHLTPDPERRLLTLLESMRRAVGWTEKKIGALTAFAAAQLAFVRVTAPAGPPGFLAMIALGAAMALGVFAFSPLTGKPGWIPFLEPPRDIHRSDDCLVSADDLAKYSRSELVLLLDQYLGGGITATRYYEDLVGQIVINARIATRKRRLFRIACVLVGLAQLCLLALVFWPQ
ncbi:MAG: hypothetical protein HY796_07795 [Elusimicrobia bacterium]|nr:hypothetical protein [Elusimicrobiota bacterium]